RPAADLAALSLHDALPISSQPVRVLSVTGTSWGRHASTTLFTMSATRGSLRSNAEPEATLQTFLTGHPMLMSIMCAPFLILNSAASAIMSGSDPAICTATGSDSPSWSSRRDDLTLFHRRGLLAAISDTA